MLTVDVHTHIEKKILCLSLSLSLSLSLCVYRLSARSLSRLIELPLIVTQCSVCFLECADNCKTCSAAGKCDVCTDGFIVNAGNTGCDGQLICL